MFPQQCVMAQELAAIWSWSWDWESHLSALCSVLWTILPLKMAESRKLEGDSAGEKETAGISVYDKEAISNGESLVRAAARFS